jgi:molybdenum-dependent DNA-binding transcriptional regulator ModE
VLLKPVISLKVNGARLTPHQLDVLLTVHQEGSQRKAGQKLKIATPVVHRYLAQMEAKAGVKLLKTSALGTTLTEDGKQIALEYSALVARMKDGGATIVGGTISTEDLLLSAVSRLDSESKYDLIIADDERNMKDFDAGLMDLVLLDDPLYAYEAENAQIEDIAGDRLIHVDKGPSYMKYRYGAQRIGFRHLDSTKANYTIDGTTRYLPTLLRSNKSCFIAESLALKKGLKLSSATDPNLLAYRILALYHGEKEAVSWLLRELKRERMGD